MPKGYKSHGELQIDKKSTMKRERESYKEEHKIEKQKDDGFGMAWKSRAIF